MLIEFSIPVTLLSTALDSGGKAARGMQMLSRIMSHHGRGGRPCPLCDGAALQCSVLDHILDHHGEELFLGPALDANKLLTLLEQLHLDFLAKIQEFVCLNGKHTGSFEVNKNNITLTVTVCIASFEVIGEVHRERFRHLRATAFSWNGQMRGQVL